MKKLADEQGLGCEWHLLSLSSGPKVLGLCDVALCCFSDLDTLNCDLMVDDDENSTLLREILRGEIDNSNVRSNKALIIMTPMANGMIDVTEDVSYTVNCSYTGLVALGLRFLESGIQEIRYRYPNTTDCTKHTVSCFCVGLKFSGPVCANSGITDSLV